MSEPGKAGNPCKYSPLFVDVARERYMHGATHAEMATLFGVVPRTVEMWVRDRKEYREAYYEARAARAAFRLSQMPALKPLFPSDPTTGPSALEDGHPVVKVERVFVEPPIRDR